MPGGKRWTKAELGVLKAQSTKWSVDERAFALSVGLLCHRTKAAIRRKIYHIRDHRRRT